MVEIIHRNHGDRPALDALEPSCAVYEWKADGDIDVEDMPGIGRWHRIPDEHFDRYVDSAGRMADHVGYHRVYIIGRPELLPPSAPAIPASSPSSSWTWQLVKPKPLDNLS